MAIKIKIHDTFYVLKDNYSITEPSGAVSTSNVDVRIDTNDVPLAFEDATIYDDDVPILWGIIQTVESPEFKSGIETKVYRLQIQSGEVVFNNRLASESYRGKYTHEIVQDLFSKYIQEEGIILGLISNTTRYYESYSFSYTKLYDVLSELASDIGASFRVSGDKKFYFLTRDNMLQVDAPEHITSLKKEETCRDVRTVQVVTGATEETSQQTIQCYWGETQNTIETGYSISEIVGATINGVIVGVGVIGLDESDATKTFLFSSSGNSLMVNTNATTKPATGNNVVIVYKGRYDIIVSNENSSLRGEVAGMNGTSGKIESIYTDETITNFQDADSVSNSLLDQYKEKEITVSCTCFDNESSNIFTIWNFTREDLGISGLFVVSERTRTKWFNSFIIKVKLKNKGYFSRYGTVLNGGIKRVGDSVTVYKTITIGDTVNCSDGITFDNAGVIFFPSEYDFIFDTIYPV